MYQGRIISFRALKITKSKKDEIKAFPVVSGENVLRDLRWEMNLVLKP